MEQLLDQTDEGLFSFADVKLRRTVSSRRRFSTMIGVNSLAE
jgi:hypothetical protein